MSDLDADLYGDLYGDENEFSVPITETKETKSEERSSGQTNSVAPATTTSKVDESSTLKEKEENSPAPIPSITSSNLSNNTPQPIQSYSSGTDYSRGDQGFRNVQQSDMGQSAIPSLPIIDRHVRPSEMKDEGKMFIGGLNWDTTDDGLRKYFEQFGKVEACTIMRDGTGRSRCFAFLTFEDPASVNAVMVREHYLDGKVIDPKRAIPRQEHQRAQKLFIGGLAGTVTSESMRDFFSQFGKVIDSTVMLDRETGRSKGFGFVSFENANIDHILGFGKLEIDGKLIDVKLAQPRHQREALGLNPNYRAEGGLGEQGDGSATNTTTTPAAAAAAATSNFANTQQQMQGSGNTPFDPQALAALYTRMFQQFGGMGGGMGMMAGGMGGMGSMGMGSTGVRMGGAVGTGGVGMGMGTGAMGQMGNRGMGGNMMGSGPVNAPRGPRGAPTGPQGGLGPQRSQRNHSYHPYSR